jgi:hypothetical protein
MSERYARDEHAQEAALERLWSHTVGITIALHHPEGISGAAIWVQSKGKQPIHSDPPTSSTDCARGAVCASASRFLWVVPQTVGVVHLFGKLLV